MPFDPRNILVIDFGQLGDVVLSLPALRAIRERFPHARITIAVGKPGGEIIRLAGYADDVLEVDRVALRDGVKLVSIGKIFRFVGQVRKGIDMISIQDRISRHVGWIVLMMGSAVETHRLTSVREPLIGG